MSLQVSRSMSVDLAILRREPDLMGHGGWEYEYEVRMGDEPIVVDRDPEFSACRALYAAGHAGKARFWREGKTQHDIEMDIARAAKWRTLETEFEGPRFVKVKEDEPEIKQKVKMENA